MKNTTIGTFIFGIILILFLFVLWCFTNTNQKETTKVLKQQSFTNIKTYGYKWFACSEDDWSHTGFTATTPYKVAVKGVVCCGLIFKNCTIRYK